MTLTFDVLQGGTITLTHYRAIVAGYTGRNAAAVQHHIDELAAIGIPAPPEVPMFYEVSASSVSTQPVFQDAPGSLTSGEVEPVYIRHRGEFYLGVGSDHTDRDLERTDIGESKRACPKPVSGAVVRVDDLSALDLDRCLASSGVDGARYQRGTLDTLRTPADVVGRLIDRLGLESEDFVCFGGTLPLLDGVFTAGRSWQLGLEFPDGTRLTHHYSMEGNAA